jgi:HSP20 family protein
MSQLPTEQRTVGDRDAGEPAAELDLLTDRMRRMLEQTFGRFATPGRLAEAVGWVPAVDIEEQDDAYVIEAELPGVKREDISIELLGNELTISGEVKQRERSGLIRRQTRRVGRFEYRVVVPDQVAAAEEIEATLHDGILTVRVPKSARTERRRIEVKAA